MAIVSFFTACSSSKVVVEPTIKNKVEMKKQFQANLTGKKTFLPEVIVENSNSNVSVDYSVVSKYDIKGKDTDAAHLFNPLLLVGFPLGDNVLFVTSKLKIIKGETLLKEYEASCLHSYTRNIFSNPDFTLMRNTCLKKLGDNINSQILTHIKKGDLNEIL